MNTQKTVNELLSQIQNEFTAYRNKLAINSSETVTPQIETTDEFVINGDDYPYEKPVVIESEIDESAFQIDESDPNIFVSSCGCGGEGIPLTPDEEEAIKAAGGKTVVAPTVVLVPSSEPESTVVPEVSKTTEKEKSFFN